jgi:hypothetical protein
LHRRDFTSRSWNRCRRLAVVEGAAGTWGPRWAAEVPPVLAAVAAVAAVQLLEREAR